MLKTHLDADKKLYIHLECKYLAWKACDELASNLGEDYYMGDGEYFLPPEPFEWGWLLKHYRKRFSRNKTLKKIIESQDEDIELIDFTELEKWGDIKLEALRPKSN